MELVVNIDNNMYYRLKNMPLVSSVNDACLKAIKNGIVLPKGHGDLIDRSKLRWLEDIYLSEEIKNAPVVVKADKGD